MLIEVFMYLCVVFGSGILVFLSLFYIFLCLRPNLVALISRHKVTKTKPFTKPLYYTNLYKGLLSFFLVGRHTAPCIVKHSTPQP